MAAARLNTEIAGRELSAGYRDSDISFDGFTALAAAIPQQNGASVWVLQRSPMIGDVPDVEMRGRREMNMMAWRNDFIYGGEVPLECLSGPKPRIMDFLDDEITAAPARLSPEACAGVLKRDEGRGKSLPERLKRALKEIARDDRGGAAE